ncbi:MAG: SdrD B-like domain-containing protein, partial [Planctomycetaceae bacterium]
MSPQLAAVLQSIRNTLLGTRTRRLLRGRRASRNGHTELLERRLLLVGDISGQVYDDVNRNNTNDAADRSLPGWTVFVDANTDGSLSPGEAFTTTDANGKYLITGILAGTRRVMTIVQPGFTPPPGLTASRTVNVRDRREVKADFPMNTAPVTTGQIVGTIFDDPNENGIKDPSEGGISGWTVFADLNSDGLLSAGEPSAVADADGDYVIAGVPAGSIRVQEVPVGAYRATAGGLFPLLNAREFRTVAVTAGGSVRADFGNWIPQVGTIQGIAWNDANGDGLRGAGEVPLTTQSVWVDLNANGVPEPDEPVRTTDATGSYSFVNIRAGVHAVTQTVPAGFITAEGRPAVVQTIVVRNGVHNVDFYNLQPLPGSLSGTLWNDADGNGLFAAAETPLAGWTVFLDANNNATLDPLEPQQQTAADGTYTFNPLPYGSKTVRVVTQGNWVVTSPPIGFSSFRLLNGENRTGVSFGLRERVGTIRGSVWNDTNGDGLQSAAEGPHSSVQVFLDTNNDGLPGADEPTTFSAADGSWEFLKVPVGNQKVVEILPPGWIPAIGRPNTVNTTVNIGGISTIAFYNLQPVLGSVSGVVFDDVNADGLLNGTDSLLEGWQVFADLNADGILNPAEPSALSSPLGAYTLADVPYGSTIVRLVPQTGFSPTTFPSGFTSFLLLNGENRTDINFGNRDLHQFSFSGNVFHDANANGLRDPGERGLSGVTIFLDTNANGTLDPGEPSTVSQLDYFFTPAIDETGNYSFTHLGRGNYSVREIVPPSQNATPPEARLRTLTLPAATPASIDFPNRFRSSEIHGIVFHDTNSNGVLDDSEYRRPDVPIFLDLDRDDFCDADEPQSTSGPDGSYVFGSLAPGAYVVREKVRQPGSISVPPTGGGILWPPGTSRPASGNVSPTSLQLTLATGQSSLHNVSLTLPGTGSLSTLVDVFLLFDDTGSFTANSPIVRAAFPTIISTLQSSLPGIDLAFGVGRFEEYANFAAEFATGRPFILNQPIVEATRPGFATSIQAALDRTAPGYGGDAPETDIEALYQLVTGLGFDGNNNGSTLESGPAGPANTQLNPGPSGDVPAFSSFLPDPANSVLAPAGTIGGAGFRPGALPVILTATDTGFAYQPKGETQVTGLNGVTLPVASLTQLSRATTPFNLGAGLQETVTGLNALGALVIGLGTNPLATQDPRQALESLAKLTGAVNRSLVSIPNGTPDPVDPGDPFYFQITTGFGTTVADGVTSAIQNAVTNVAMDITVRASDPRVQLVNHTGTLTSIAAGQTAAFDVEFIGDGRPARFDLQFIRSGTSVVLGSIPVVIGTPIPGDGYNFDDLEDGEIHNSSHFGHVIPNQAPVFSISPESSAQEDAGLQVIPSWATAISPGDVTEIRQTLQFTLTTSNPALFSVAPTISPDGTLTWQSAPNAFGTSEVTVILHDNGGTAAGGSDTSISYTFLISVLPVNDAPIATPDAWTVQENTLLSITAPGVLANDSDADGDTIFARIVTAPGHGTLALNPDGSFLYTPASGYFGADSFTYANSDSLADSPPAVVALTVFHVNQAPVGRTDNFSGTEDFTLFVTAPGVLANDFDADSDPLTVRILQAPARGLLVLNTDGGFLYTPVAN